MNMLPAGNDILPLFREVISHKKQPFWVPLIFFFLPNALSDKFLCGLSTPQPIFGLCFFCDITSEYKGHGYGKPIKQEIVHIQNSTSLRAEDRLRGL